MLLLGIVVITSPVIVVIITKLTYRPFYVLPFYFEDSCPNTVSFSNVILSKLSLKYDLCLSNIMNCNIMLFWLLFSKNAICFTVV